MEQPIQTEWVVITGAPSAGKTTLISYLAFLGYRTMPEAARLLIDLEVSGGHSAESVRADESSFQLRNLEMKVEMERRINRYERIFLDRGIPDSFAYYNIFELDDTPVKLVANYFKYKHVFLLRRLPVFDSDYARAKDVTIADEIEKKIAHTYQNLGYRVVWVPFGTIKQRAEIILHEIGDLAE